MNKLLTIGNFEFKESENVIHCKIDSAFNKEQLDNNTILIFQDAITSFFEGSYMSIIIDMSALNIIQSIKLFKFLTTNTQFNKLVLLKTFLVDSYILKAFFVFYGFICNPILPDIVFSNYLSASKYCRKKYSLFNDLS